MRRAALLPFFSTAYVRKMQPYFQERLDVLLRRMSGFKDTNEAVNANCMFAAFSNGEASGGWTNDCEGSRLINVPIRYNANARFSGMLS